MMGCLAVAAAAAVIAPGPTPLATVLEGQATHTSLSRTEGLTVGS